jgi:hypothetical protein
MPTFTHEQMSGEFEKFHAAGFPFPLTIHHFTAPDKGGFHDHPYGFWSTVLHGSYVEEVLHFSIMNNQPHWIERIERKRGDTFYIPAEHIHRIVAIDDIGECYTLIRPEGWSRHTHWWELRDGQLYGRQWDSDEWVHHPQYKY